jgi:hypothetical protein
LCGHTYRVKIYQNPNFLSLLHVNSLIENCRCIVYVIHLLSRVDRLSYVRDVVAACISTSVVIFGVMIGLDRTWMPRWDTNVLGWSYGVVVVAGFFSTFSFIAIVVYTLARKYEIAAAKNRANGKGGSSKTKAQLVPRV